MKSCKDMKITVSEEVEFPGKKTRKFKNYAPTVDSYHGGLSKKLTQSMRDGFLADGKDLELEVVALTDSQVLAWMWNLTHRL
mmetsp:Transcript_8838/g.13576  ORF Transcript_8838/g.13576 Transcript_8838/m.13576 type:complete len:82 (+) Transcript_8838:8430-8675(+)